MDEITCCRYEDSVKALADETRQAILELLQEGEVNVGEVAACFNQTQPTISYHLGLLRRAGLVVARREGKQVMLVVQDTGAGISSDELPHVFDRLYRGSEAREGNGGESGLGLAIARSIVEVSGGTISVESTLRQGTTFTIALPASL